MCVNNEYLCDFINFFYSFISFRDHTFVYNWIRCSLRIYWKQETWKYRDYCKLKVRRLFAGFKEERKMKTKERCLLIAVLKMYLIIAKVISSHYNPLFTDFHITASDFSISFYILCYISMVTQKQKQHSSDFNCNNSYSLFIVKWLVSSRRFTYNYQYT